MQHLSASAAELHWLVLVSDGSCSLSYKKLKSVCQLQTCAFFEFRITFFCKVETSSLHHYHNSSIRLGFGYCAEEFHSSSRLIQLAVVYSVGLYCVLFLSGLNTALSEVRYLYTICNQNFIQIRSRDFREWQIIQQSFVRLTKL